MEIKQLFRTKIFKPDTIELKRCLSALDLTLMGIGAIIGAGIFVLTGIAAATKAGPAIGLSYILAGIASAFAALCYAELASSVGGSGSAYNYAYSTLGEFFAWIIGWDLLLEYGLGACAVAIGWSGYANNALSAMGLQLPRELTHTPFEGGLINLPATLIVLFLTALLGLGIRQSNHFNIAIVTVKLIAIFVFIGVALQDLQPDYWQPFMPFGWSGIVSGAALVFFAYIGFDAVSTAAEEAINPQRNLPLGIVASLFVCTVLYVIVAFMLTGITSYTQLNVGSPVAETILKLGHRLAAGIVAAGAIAGLTSVILIFIYALSRIFFAMSRDGLLPPIFSKICPRTKVPLMVVFTSGLIIALGAGFLSLSEVAALVNIGTLFAFIVVCSGVIILRRTQPSLPRPFKTPYNPLFPILGILFCSYLIYGLPLITWLRYIIWMFSGFFIYFLYGYHNSKLRGTPLKEI